jgi:hypothetical protein
MVKVALRGTAATSGWAGPTAGGLLLPEDSAVYNIRYANRAFRLSPWELLWS